MDIISIGDELLIGQTLNTNAYWIAKKLTAIGFTIRQQLAISDQEEVILSALKDALLYSDVVIITGGLGPTNDDLTMPALNKYFGGKLITDEKVYAHIEKIILNRGFKMNENNKKQAIVPDNCKVLHNENGTAPGLWFERDNKVVVALPGVPYEMEAMISDVVISHLKKKYQLPEIINHMVYTQGLPESMLAERLVEWEDSLSSQIKLAYLPSPGRVKLRLSSIGLDRQELQKKIDIAVEKLKHIIPEYIYSEDNENLEIAIGDLLKKKNKTVATAESCTGGYIAHLITKVAGSSAYYKGSVISYSNEIKENELAVASEDLNLFGAVSQQVVEQMAIGVRQKMDTDYGLATSGVAGPTGGTEEKPVGTIWVAVATPNGVISKKYLFGKLRHVNIERTAMAALGMLRQELL